MKKSLTTMRYLCGLACTLLLSLLPPCASAQQQPLPTLKQVLAGIDRNYAAYLRNLPNLYADEQLFSTVTFAHPTVGTLVTQQQQQQRPDVYGINQHVTYDSIYRLRRNNQHDDRVLEETRQVVSVDHQPARPELQIDVPFLVIDPQYAPNVFAAAWGQCFDFKLLPSRLWQGKTVWVVSFTSARRTGLQMRCPIHEPISGRAFIEPGSMQFIRFEETRPRHTPDQRTLLNTNISRESYGLWKWSVDYTTVTLEGRDFRLPKAITSTFEMLPHVTWSSQSSFTHYQLADVHSKILLPDGSPLPHQ